jgi:hypothetical protein
LGAGPARLRSGPFREEHLRRANVLRDDEDDPRRAALSRASALRARARVAARAGLAPQPRQGAGEAAGDPAAAVRRQPAPPDDHQARPDALRLPCRR